MGRALALIGIVASLFVAAACGGESELCESLDDVQGSVQAIRDIDLDEGAVDELRQEADELDSNLTAAQEAAGDELGDEITAVQTSAQALRAEAEALADDGEITREAIAALAEPISNAANSFQALVAAAPDCDL